MNFEQFEQTRLAYLNKRKKVRKITLVILSLPTLLVLFLFFSTSNPNTTFNIFSLFFLLFPLSFFLMVYIISITIATRKEHAAYKKAYKTYFVAKSLSKIFTNIEYDHLGAMPEAHIRQVMERGDRYTSNDFLTATYKSINFTQADVKTEDEHTNKDGDTTYQTIFYGRFFIFDFNRNFDFALQILTKHFPHAVRPQSSNSQLKFHKLKTESIDFNQDFIIYGQDGVDTFYILDPAFIEKLHNLYHQLNSEFAITFLDGKIYIAVNNHKDAFEAPNPKKPVDEQTEITKVSQDIKAITNFVDNLNLDKYTYKRSQK